jgi:hypothetical protein
MPLCRYFTSTSRVTFPIKMTRLKLAMAPSPIRIGSDFKGQIGQRQSFDSRDGEDKKLGG